jgi:nucleotide-binding universal stress UspA family protein
MKHIRSQCRANPGSPVADGHGERLADHRGLISARIEADARGEQGLAAAPECILVPLALPGDSYVALAIAQKLAVDSGAKLVLLHVVQLNIAGEERGIQRGRLVSELCRNAECELQRLASCLGDRASTQVLVCEGRPAEVIVQTARRMEAGTIVMCTRGDRGWLKGLHRNTALKVMRQSPCPIWLVAPGKGVDAMHLMIVGHKTIRRNSETVAVRETPNPFRFLLRVLFSRFGNSAPGGTGGRPGHPRGAEQMFRSA